MRLDVDLVAVIVQVVLLETHVSLCAFPSSLHYKDNDLRSQGKPGSGGGGGLSQASGGSQEQSPHPVSRHQSHWDRHSPDSSGFHSRQQRWAREAFHFVHSLDCDDVFFTTSKECKVLVTIPKHRMAVHMATPSPYGKFRTAIPEESLTGSGLHDAVLVVDPYPRANFGHLLLVFFIDSRVSRNHCQRKGGVYLDGDECMHLALRRRCRNALQRLSRRRNYARRCEINFLPVVHLWTRRSDFVGTASNPHAHQHDRQNPHQQQHASSTVGESHQSHTRNHLQCRSELAGFGTCPPLRPANLTERLACDHLRDNTRRCSTTHDSVKTNCRMFEVCDQAVLISGGWNRQTSGLQHLNNLQLMYGMLRRNGFKRRNIKVFFGNGAPALKVAGDPPHRVYPATVKLAMRNHLRRLCLTFHCVDSLLLYLNSPAGSDGSALLWDIDGNGLATDEEQYTVQELKEDLADCAARQITLLVDQSFSGEVVHALRQSPPHSNLLVFASGKSGEYSYGGEFTRFWASCNHTRSCTTDIHAASRTAVKQSNPRMGEGEEGRVRTTIFGAPCNVRPPFSVRELRQQYYGCQNLPTAVWLRQILRSSDTGFFLNTDAHNNRGVDVDDDDDNDDDDK